MKDFGRVYREAAADIVPFLTPERLEVIGRHNPGWKPGRFDASAYLETSEIRYAAALAAFERHGGEAVEGPLRVLDVGGFMGALPLAMARLGAQVTLSENYGYYEGAFDELRDYLAAEGVEIWNLDLSEPLESVPADRFDLVAAMAILEHLPSSPRPLLLNAKALLAESGRLVVDVPNIAYWPNRVGLHARHQPATPDGRRVSRRVAVHRPPPRVHRARAGRRSHLERPVGGRDRDAQLHAVAGPPPAAAHRCGLATEAVRGDARGSAGLRVAGA